MSGRVRQSGVTLIEMLVVIVIAGIISTTLILVWSSLRDSYAFTTESSNAQDFARDAVARMARELRDAEPKGTSLAIVYADNDEVQFYTTFNKAGNESRLVEPVLTTYRYVYDGTRGVGALRRIRGTVDTIVVDNLMNPIDGGEADVFRYAYISTDSTYVPDAKVPELDMYGTISRVHISLMVDVNPEHSPRSMNVSTTVHLRNQSVY